MKLTEIEGDIVDKNNYSLWEKFFGSSYPDEQKRKVREYISHRIGEGAHLRDVLQEEYVQRNASSTEVQEILQNPELIEAAHEHMKKDISSEKLDPTSPSSTAQ